MRNLLTSFWKDEGGATAMEYCLIALCVFLAIVTAASLMSSSLTESLANTAARIIEALD